MGNEQSSAAVRATGQRGNVGKENTREWLGGPGADKDIRAGIHNVKAHVQTTSRRVRSFGRTAQAAAPNALRTCPQNPATISGLSARPA